MGYNSSLLLALTGLCLYQKLIDIQYQSIQYQLKKPNIQQSRKTSPKSRKTDPTDPEKPNQKSNIGQLLSFSVQNKKLKTAATCSGFFLFNKVSEKDTKNSEQANEEGVVSETYQWIELFNVRCEVHDVQDAVISDFKFLILESAFRYHHDRYDNYGQGKSKIQNLESKIR
jgi:hypothetical protein